MLCICILWLAIGKKQTRQEEAGERAATAAVPRLRWQHSRLLHVASRAHTHTQTHSHAGSNTTGASVTLYMAHTERELVLSQVSVRYIQAHFRMWMWRKKAGCANRPLSLSSALSHTLSLSDSPSLSPLLLIITKALTLFDGAYPWDTRCFCLLVLLLLLLPLRGLSPVSFFCRFLGDLVSKRTCRKTNTSSPRADVVSARVQLQQQQQQR